MRRRRAGAALGLLLGLLGCRVQDPETSLLTVELRAPGWRGPPASELRFLFPGGVTRTDGDERFPATPGATLKIGLARLPATLPREFVLTVEARDHSCLVGKGEQRVRVDPAQPRDAVVMLTEQREEGCATDAGSDDEAPDAATPGGDSDASALGGAEHPAVDAPAEDGAATAPDGPTGRVSLMPTMAAFGSLDVGLTSAPTAFTLVNLTGTRVAPQVAVDGPGRQNFALVDSCRGKVLGAGEACAFSVSFAPKIVGGFVAEIRVTSAGAVPVFSPLSASLTGTGTAAPMATLGIEPQAQNYGGAVVGDFVAGAFTITNTGNARTGSLSAATVTGDNASDFDLIGDGCQGVDLQPLERCAIKLHFWPKTTGSKTAILLVAGTATYVKAMLTGTAYAGATLEITPATYSFNATNINQESANQTFTVKNAGGAQSGAVTIALLGGAPSQFRIVGNNCGGVPLVPQATCTVALVFQPTSTGPQQAQLTVMASPGGMAVAAVDGTGTAP